MFNLTDAWSYLMHGGPMMVPIVLVSLIGVALIIERSLALRKSKVVPASLLQAVESSSGASQWTELLALCKLQPSALARLVQRAIELKNEDAMTLQTEIERLAKKEAGILDKNLVFLGILAALGPLLGLFGTVTGMIATFSAVRVSGVGNPQELSGGISEALLCTAGGMTIGIPSLIAYRYLAHKVDTMMATMEDALTLLSQRFKKVA